MGAAWWRERSDSLKFSFDLQTCMDATHGYKDVRTKISPLRFTQSSYVLEVKLIACC